MVAQLNNTLTYDPSIRGYVLPNGEPVPREEIERMVDAIRGSLGGKLERITEDLLAGQITLTEWQIAMAQATKDESIVAALLAIGGLAALAALNKQQSSSIWFAVGEHLRSQVKGIDRIANKISKGNRTPAQLRAYARYKASGVIGAYHRARRVGFMVAGFNEARRSLDPFAKHCPDCPAYETSDWVPIEEVVPVGHACRCNGRCRCRVQYRFNPERVLQKTLIEQLNDAREREKTTQAALLERLS